MKRGFFFDVDDTLCATGKAHSEAYVSTFRKLGMNLPTFEYSRFTGVQTDVVFRALIPGADEETVSNAVRVKRQFFKESVKGIEPMVGAVDLLKYLQNSERKIIAVSSGSASSVNATLESTKISNYFDAIITCDSVQNTKPHADPYLYAIQRAELDPVDCIAIEDSEIGVQSALAANLEVAVISSSFPEWMSKYAISHYKSLNMFKKNLEAGNSC
jgi:HAD superfamily hydrolase (TIGR01509 family)